MLWFRSLLLFTIIWITTIPIDAQERNCGFPGESWQYALPEDAGLDQSLLLAGDATIPTEMPFLRSVLLIRNGCLVFERYFAEADSDTLVNIFSVTKSVTASLIGTAIAEGAIESVDTSIARYLPDALDADEQRSQITIHHLLKMLSGLGWNEDRDIGGMLALQRDEVAFILDLPQRYRPGNHWNYSTADSHLLSAILTEATGESALSYATTHLFSPLNITDVRWTEDANGYNLGGTQLFMRPQDMARFGLLYASNGTWGEEQLVPSAWVEFVTTPQLSDPTLYEVSYAAHWWRVHLGNYPAMFAAVGYGGQYILIAPEQNMVIVTTANSYVREPDRYVSPSTARDQEEAILDYVERVILPAVSD